MIPFATTFHIGSSSHFPAFVLPLSLMMGTSSMASFLICARFVCTRAHVFRSGSHKHRADSVDVFHLPGSCRDLAATPASSTHEGGGELDIKLRVFHWSVRSSVRNHCFRFWPHQALPLQLSGSVHGELGVPILDDALLSCLHYVDSRDCADRPVHRLLLLLCKKVRALFHRRSTHQPAHMIINL